VSIELHALISRFIFALGPSHPSIDTSPSFFRFEKNDILRIVRALAIVRPSLIALQMPLSEEDEVFVEKCFQRSLLVSVTGEIHFMRRVTCAVPPLFFFPFFFFLPAAN